MYFFFHVPSSSERISPKAKKKGCVLISGSSQKQLGLRCAKGACSPTDCQGLPLGDKSQNDVACGSI